MKKRTNILASLLLAALVGAATIWNWSAATASAQKPDDEPGTVIVGASGYDARLEFSNVQNPNGAWSYGYSVSDTDNTLNLFAFPADSLTSPGCGGGNFEAWRINNGDQIPQIARHSTPILCSNIPGNALFIHPGFGGQRAVVRWTAPAAGTFQLTGSLQRQNPIATTDLKIIKNAATPGETTVFAGSNVSTYQIAYNLTVTVAAGDRLDFSVGNGNGSQISDGSSIVINIAPPVAACLPPPANLQVSVPAENSPVDVASLNTRAQLVGDATYTNTGRVGRAFEFDGAGDYVRIEDNAAQRPATAVTAEGWFKFDATPGIVSLISKPLRGSPLNSYTLYLENGQLRGLVSNGPQYTRVFSGFTPQTGVWHHLAFTYDYTGGVSTLRLYANGVEVTSGQDGAANLLLAYDANPFPLLIGGEYENNAQGFTLDGQADEIGVYGRALAANEIFDLVRAGSRGKCSPAVCAQTPGNLVSWFAGEDNALDSRSNNHGTLQNGAGYANGKVGRALSLDGIDDRVLIGDPIPPSLQIQNDISLNAWIYVTEYPSTGERLGMIVGSQYDVTGSGASIMLDGRTNPDGQPAPPGHIHFQIGDGGFHVTNAQTAVPLNQWVHISANRRANEDARIYYNGVLQPSTSAPWSGSISYNGAWFAIGQQKDINRPFKGLIDEVSVFSRSLAESEVQSVVNAGASGMCKPAATNPAANQIAWFSGDGDARDFLGLNPEGILRGDANFRVGRVGQSFNFDGSGDYVEIPDDADHRPANVTVEGWFKVNSLGGAPHFVSKPLVGTNSNSYVVWYQDGQLRGGHGNQSGGFDTLFTGFSPNLGEWYHYAYTIDDAADTHRFFVNGVQVAAAATSLPIFYDASPHPLLIGAELDSNVLGAYLNGQADEVSLYSRALSASEIAAVYEAGAAGKVKAKTVSLLPPATAKTKSAKSALASPSLLAPATVRLSDATVTFANLTASGTVSENNIDLAFLPPLPSSVSFTGLAYDVAATAGYQSGSPDDVQVCFNVPALPSIPFASLRVLHLENGAWVNRTAAANTSPNLCTDNLTSLSPFVIVQALAPTAAGVSVAGRVTDAGGAGLGGVSVTLTDSQGRSVYAKTNNFGKYSFANVAAGEVYIVSVSSKRYTFAVSSQAVSVQDAVENVDFTADSAN